ncbi:MAG: hypothetical protein KatS3mg091_460 [Patescibacteria group bacterium]|nr:MAG: hypothetical protein KatS3mg091_460 [Patescibacteria group bacterium]
MNLDEVVSAIKTTEDPFSKGRLIKQALTQFSLTYNKLSKLTGIQTSYLAHYVRLLKLPDLIVDGYYSQIIPITHLLILSRLKNEQDMIKLYEEILKNNYTAAQTEERVRNILHNIYEQGYSRYYSEDKLKKLKKAIKEKLNHNVMVKIVQSRVKTKLVIELKANLLESNLMLKQLEKIFDLKDLDQDSEANK